MPRITLIRLELRSCVSVTICCKLSTSAVFLLDCHMRDTLQSVLPSVVGFLFQPSVIYPAATTVVCIVIHRTDLPLYQTTSRFLLHVLEQRYVGPPVCQLEDNHTGIVF